MRAIKSHVILPNELSELNELNEPKQRHEPGIEAL
jgi:hypothetical protein